MVFKASVAATDAKCRERSVMWSDLIIAVMLHVPGPGPPELLLVPFIYGEHGTSIIGLVIENVTVACRYVLFSDLFEKFHDKEKTVTACWRLVANLKPESSDYKVPDLFATLIHVPLAAGWCRVPASSLHQ